MKDANTPGDIQEPYVEIYDAVDEEFVCGDCLEFCPKCRKSYVQ
jgi:hypothetical protein